MNTEDKYKIMLAFSRGADIERLSCSGWGWVDYPTWDWRNEMYRVQPPDFNLDHQLLTMLAFTQGKRIQKWGITGDWEDVHDLDVEWNWLQEAYRIKE